MTYGRLYNKSSSRTTGRTSYARYRSKSTAAKAKATTAARFAPAKKAKPTIRRNTTAINRNTARLNKLAAQQYGYYQTQTQISNALFNVTESTPAICQLTNLAHGATGAHFKYPHNYTNGLVSDSSLPDLQSFSVFTAPMMGDSDMIENVQHHVPNGNRLMWRMCELKFEVSGFLDNTNVDIWIVQERPQRQDPWHTRGTHGLPTHLPYTVPQFCGISGFTANRINYKKYKVLKHRHLFFNSKPSSSLLDGTVGEVVSEGAQQATVDATTRHIKQCSIKWRPNMLLKQLKHSMSQNEDVMRDTPNMDGNTSFAGAGSWHWDNIDPLQNIWCIITTDDSSTLGSTLDGDAVTVNVIRRNVWQDIMD